MSQEADQPAIELVGVNKAFKRRPAVINLDLTVPRGSIFGLLGHNGAGKSTSLGMVLGQVFPDTGDVRVHGHNVFTRRKKALSRIGAIFEAPCFYDYLSAYRNLRIFNDYTHRVDKKRLEEVIDLVGLSKRIKDRVGTYSHGMRQRLGLAQALLPDPDTLILDEPSDGLDPEGIREMRQLIRRLNNEMGLTILFSSHLLTEVEQLASRVAVMNQGKLVFNGIWAEVREQMRYISLETDQRGKAIGELRAAGMVGEESHGKLALVNGSDSAAVNAYLMQRGYRVSAIAPVRLTLEEFYLQTVEEADASS